MNISLFVAEKMQYGRDYTITIKGKPYKGVLYEGYRVREPYRKSQHLYGLRHSDNDCSEPVTVAPGLPLVNFFGTFVTKKPLPITEETDIENAQ